MMELQKLIETERERCAQLVEQYRPKCHGHEESVIIRIINQIRLGLEPDPFGRQIVSEETTPYANPQTVADERARCLICVAMHLYQGTTRLQGMLAELAKAIVAGPS